MNPRYVSLMRQRSTTTTSTIPEDTLIETTTKYNFEESRENKNTKVSDAVFTTEFSIISTTSSFNTEPFVDIITTMNVPTSTSEKSSEGTTFPISTTDKFSEGTKIPTSIINEKFGDILSTTKVPTPIIQDNDVSSTKVPTSTITNVVTSIYEAATERQRVRVKNIQNFLLEHKKSEPIPQSISHTTIPSTTTSITTMENVVAVEEPTQKSILKGRFGGQVQFRPTLRKLIGTSERSVTSDKINDVITEKKMETTTEQNVDTTTKKKFRLNKYINRFVRPVNNSVENTSTIDNRIITPTTESSLESSTRQFNRFRLTTESSPESNTRQFNRFRSTASSETVIGSTQEPRIRQFVRSRPINNSDLATVSTLEPSTRQFNRFRLTNNSDIATRSTLEISSRQFNRFRSTTNIDATIESTAESSTRQSDVLRSSNYNDTDNSASLTRRSFSRFRPSSSEAPSTNNTQVLKSRHLRSRRPITSSSTSTTSTEVAKIRDLLDSEENVDSFRYETTTYTPTTFDSPLINYEETSPNNEEFKTTVVENFEPTKYTNEITTIQPTTTRNKVVKISRGSVRANNSFDDDAGEKSRSPSSGRQNSRFLKDEQKKVLIRVSPLPNGRSQNELTSSVVKVNRVNINRGRIRAFDSLELNTLADGLTNDDRPNELFRGSETKFRVQQSTTTTTESTEEV